MLLLFVWADMKFSTEILLFENCKMKQIFGHINTFNGQYF